MNRNVLNPSVSKTETSPVQNLTRNIHQTTLFWIYQKNYKRSFILSVALWGKALTLPGFRHDFLMWPIQSDCNQSCLDYFNYEQIVNHMVFYINVTICEHTFIHFLLKKRFCRMFSWLIISCNHFGILNVRNMQDHKIIEHKVIKCLVFSTNSTKPHRTSHLWTWNQ